MVLAGRGRLQHFVFCSLFFGVSAAFAQQVFRQWRVSDGLPENRVQSFAQTPEGILWIGTSGGLVSFDGSSLETFDHNNTKAMEESNITALFQAGGVLWIGTDGGGVLRYADHHFGVYAVPGVPPSASVRSITRDRRGRMWLSSDSGVASWKDLNGRANDIHLLSREDYPRSLDLDAENEVISFPGHVSNGFYRHAAIHAVCKDRDGTLWVGTDEGLFSAKPGGGKLRPVASMHYSISALLLGKDGQLWAGTVRDGLFEIRGERVNAVKSLEAFHAEAITALFEDSNGTLWIGTQTGMFQMLQSSLEVVHLPDVHAAEFGTVYLDTQGAVWAAGRRLFQVRNGVPHAVQLPRIHDADVRSVVYTPDRSLWVGTSRSGIFRMKNKTVTHFGVRQGLAGDAVRVMSVSADGSVWVGTDDGLSHIVGDVVRTYRTADGLPHPVVHAVIEDGKKDIWVGTARGLSHLHGGEIVPNALTKQLATEKVWSMTSGPGGELWVGTRSSGLYCWYRERLLHFSTKEGLASNSIYKILLSAPDLPSPDRIWLSGPGGISAVSRQELLTHAQTGKEIVPTIFYASDEHGALNFYGGIQSSGAMGPAGDVWFPSDHGPVHITMHDAHKPAFTLRIKAVIANGRDLLKSTQPVLTADEQNLQISYSAVQLLPQDGIRYRYRLEGVDSGWTFAQTRKTAYYTNLPAGTFRFHLQAYKAGFAGGESETALLIVKKQHYYSTMWFRILSALLFGLLLWTAHKMRVHLHRRRLRAVFEERLRLSREVHDTILQGCAGVSSLLEACRHAPRDLPETEVLLEHARDQISITMDDARRAIQWMRGAEQNSVDVRTSLNDLAQRLQSEWPTPIDCLYRGPDIALPADRVHEIEMVAREAIYNALVHSECKRVEVRVAAEGVDLSVHVHDNGRGMDTLSAPKQGHYGLVSMQERVERLGGSFRLQSSPGKGTTVLFRVPTKDDKRGKHDRLSYR